MEIEVVDLRHLSRNSESCLTEISLGDRSRSLPWLTLGQVNIDPLPSTALEGKKWRLYSYLKNATDYDHSSALLLDMSLIGLEFVCTHYHRSVFAAWVDPSPRKSFYVPPASWNPASPEMGGSVCTECEPSHPLVVWDCYVPPYDPELFALVAGKELRISIGPVD